MYLFIKFYITAQSGRAILVILCHSHWSFQGRIDDNLVQKTSDQTRQRGYTLSTVLNLSPERLALPCVCLYCVSGCSVFVMDAGVFSVVDVDSPVSLSV